MLYKETNFQVPAYEAAKGRSVYTNPVILDFADPCITFDHASGWYYATRSYFGKEGVGICICRGKTLTELPNETRVIFYTGEKFGLYRDVWASEIHRIGERWYIYAAASCHPTEGWEQRRMRTFVLESKTDDPFEGFNFAGVLGLEEPAIDATVFQCRNGKLYLCFSRCIDVDRQKLMIQEMASPTQLKGEAMCIARATYPWELIPPYNGVQRINEGPFFIEHENRTFCVFSVNGCWVDEYGLGIMELVGDDPMNVSAWVKDDVPWLSGANGMYATGHASFFHAPDGKNLYIAYHAVLQHNPNDQPLPRHCCVQKVYFDRTGFPHVGKPIPKGQPIPLPEGDPGRAAK